MVGHEVMGGQLPLGVGQVDGIAAAGRVTGGFLVTEGIRTAADHTMSARRVRFVDNTVIAVVLDMGAYFGEYACPCVVSAKGLDRIIRTLDTCIFRTLVDSELCSRAAPGCAVELSSTVNF
jgi:hypothetical protein